MSAERLYHATAPRSGLHAALEVLRAEDGGATAVRVALRAASGGPAVVLKANEEMSAFIALTVTDARGTVLSRPARRFSSEEEQTFRVERIAPGESRRWRVPLTGQLDAGAVPPAGMRGRLVVNVTLLVGSGPGADVSATGGFETEIVTLYDMDVLFTRAALAGHDESHPPAG